jgi:hypothetical protein
MLRRRGDPAALPRALGRRYDARRTMNDASARNDDSIDGPGRKATAGAPRWVRLLGLVLLAVVVVLIVMQVTGEGLFYQPPPVT